MILFWNAYRYLVLFERHVARKDFASLYRAVSQHPCALRIPIADEVERVCAAVDKACAFYWKQVLCLQRSAATACLLRNYGVRAELVIGTQQLPFNSHAWVEVEGRVVNDRPYVRDVYAVLARC